MQLLAANRAVSREALPGHEPTFGKGVFALEKMVGSGFDRFMTQVVQKDRTREMLWEDIIGFGVIRTGIDLFRNYFYAKDAVEKRTLNFSAARERMIRELGSVFTDNIFAGVLAWTIADLGEKYWTKKPQMANQFMSLETIELMETLAKESHSPKQLVQKIAEAIAPKRPVVSTYIANDLKNLFQKDETLMQAVKEHLENAFSGSGRREQILKDNQKLFDELAKVAKKNMAADYQRTAVSIAKHLGLDKFDHQIKGQWFNLETLLEDTHQLLIRSRAFPNWQKDTLGLLRRTKSFGFLLLPATISVAMLMTFSVPFINRAITRRVDGEDEYPGEKGLKLAKRQALKKQKSKLDWWFPFLSQTAKAGNILPAVLSATPLLFAFGLFDTVKMSKGFAKGWFNPFWKSGYIKRWAQMMQFGKGFPFTTQNQMASCYALLISSRLATTRDGIEFRERLVDTFLSWTVWILATPILKRAFAKWRAPELLKKVGDTEVIKSAIEIEKFTPPHLTKQLLGRYKAISWASLAISLFLLGVIEPLIGIKWTERQVKRAAKKEAESQKQQPPVISNKAPEVPVAQPIFRQAMPINPPSPIWLPPGLPPQFQVIQ